MALLDAGGAALAGSRALLLETLFTLAQDEWPQVAGPVRAWLRRRRAAGVRQSREPGCMFMLDLPAGMPKASCTCGIQLTACASM